HGREPRSGGPWNEARSERFVRPAKTWFIPATWILQMGETRTRVPALGSGVSSVSRVMGADSFQAAAAVGDAFLSVLAEKWRELHDAPAASPAGIGYRPAREAAEMRRLCRMAEPGGLPADAIARIWRSMCGDMLVARGLKAVYVAGGDI